MCFSFTSFLRYMTLRRSGEGGIESCSKGNHGGHCESAKTCVEMMHPCIPATDWPVRTSNSVASPSLFAARSCRFAGAAPSTPTAAPPQSTLMGVRLHNRPCHANYQTERRGISKDQRGIRFELFHTPRCRLRESPNSNSCATDSKNQCVTW